MDTIIRIKKNKPAYRALIQLAKELKKADSKAIYISESESETEVTVRDLIKPGKNTSSPLSLFDELSDFPTIEEIRKHAWPGI